VDSRALFQTLHYAQSQSFWSVSHLKNLLKTQIKNLLLCAQALACQLFIDVTVHDNSAALQKLISSVWVNELASPGARIVERLQQLGQVGVDLQYSSG
jgi:hypothetical protein